MDLNSRNLKLSYPVYLTLLLVGLFFFIFNIDLKDLTNFDFISSKRDIIFEYKQENFLLLYWIFSILYIFGFFNGAMSILIFAGLFLEHLQVFQNPKSTTIGATLLYYIVGIFFRDLIKKN